LELGFFNGQEEGEAGDMNFSIGSTKDKSFFRGVNANNAEQAPYTGVKVLVPGRYLIRWYTEGQINPETSPNMSDPIETWQDLADHDWWGVWVAQHQIRNLQGGLLEDGQGDARKGTTSFFINSSRPGNCSNEVAISLHGDRIVRLRISNDSNRGDYNLRGAMVVTRIGPILGEAI
jgi:hypothetical protein